MYSRSSLRSIVTHEDNKGVIIFSGFLQVLNHLADIVVHSIDHSGIRLHRPAGQFLSLWRKVRPFARVHSGCFNIVRNDRLVNDSHLNQFRKTALSQGIWTFVIYALILVTLLLGAL